MRTTPVAVAPPGLPLPDVSDRATYTARKLVHLDWERNVLTAGALALAQAALDNALDANVSAIAAAANVSATDANTAIALAAANFKGTYPSRTGPANTPYSVSQDGGFWMLLQNMADVTTKVPGVAGSEAYWQRIDRPPTVTLTTASVQQAVSGGAYGLTNATAQGAATNLVLYSSQADNAAWIKTSATVTADATMAPDGSTTGDKIVEAAAMAVHSLAQTVTAAANVQFSYSVYVKAGGRTSVAIAIDRDAGMVDYCRAVFNLTTGAVTGITNAGTGSGAAGSAIYIGFGWWLLRMTGTPSTTAGTQVRATLFLTDQNANAGDGVSGVYVAEAQLETGANATSRIPTTAAAATRASGVIAPQRVILPALTANAWVEIVPMNGVANILDPDGAGFYTASGATLQGPMSLDNAGLPYFVQAINNVWRFM